MASSEANRVSPAWIQGLLAARDWSQSNQEGLSGESPWGRQPVVHGWRPRQVWKEDLLLTLTAPLVWVTLPR